MRNGECTKYCVCSCRYNSGCLPSEEQLRESMDVRSCRREWTAFWKILSMPIIKKESKLAEEEKREPELMPPISSHTLRHTGCTRLGENNVNPKVMQYVMGCWMSSGHPFSTDRSGAKNIQMHRSQWMSIIILQRSLTWRMRCLKWTCQKPYLLWYKP